MNDTLYLIGGAGRVTERDRTTVSVGAIDIWDIENKQWCLKSEMSIPRHGHSVAYIGKCNSILVKYEWFHVKSSHLSPFST